MNVQAAILRGPQGQFAVLRAKPEAGEPTMTDRQRREVAACFKSRHDNIPVAFLANEPGGLQLISYEDASDDLQRCVRELVTPDVQWQDFQPPPTGM